MRKWKYVKSIDINELNSKILTQFFQRIEITNHCWLWNGRKTNGGYGVFSFNNNVIRAHRFSYELFKNEIPVNLDLDHLCRNTKCVNPQHLEPVSKYENQKRSPITNMNKTHCPQGHEYSSDNLYVSPKGFRFCRICKNAHERLRRTKPEYKLYNKEYSRKYRKERRENNA